MPQVTLVNFVSEPHRGTIIGEWRRCFDSNGDARSARNRSAGTGSATSGRIYTALTAGTLTFAAGVTSQTFDVSVSDDGDDEPNETVAVRLSNPVGATFYGGAMTLTGTGTIIDDDAVMLRIDSPSVAEGAAGANPHTPLHGFAEF